MILNETPLTNSLNNDTQRNTLNETPLTNSLNNDTQRNTPNQFSK